MKKEYVKPTLLVLTTEPSQIMVTSNMKPETENGPGFGDDDLPPPTKGAIWDDFYWGSTNNENEEENGW